MTTSPETLALIVLITSGFAWFLSRLDNRVEKVRDELGALRADVSEIKAMLRRTP
jgi:hypothetical protein